MQPFRSLQDDDVSHRYQYGQLRLTRLNWAVRIIHVIGIICPVCTKQQLPWNYREGLWQTSRSLQHYAAPLIFIFAFLSLVLSSMQVALATLGNDTWEMFVKVSWGFSVATMVFAACPIIGALIGVSVLLIAQGQFAARMKWKEMYPKSDIEHQNASLNNRDQNRDIVGNREIR